MPHVISPHAPPAAESAVNPAHALRAAEAWQASAWVRGVAWAPALPHAGFQLGWNSPEGFDPVAGGLVFDSLAAAIRHAREAGWIR